MVRGNTIKNNRQQLQMCLLCKRQSSGNTAGGYSKAAACFFIYYSCVCNGKHESNTASFCEAYLEVKRPLSGHALFHITVYSIPTVFNLTRGHVAISNIAPEGEVAAHTFPSTFLSFFCSGSRGPCTPGERRDS